MLKGVGIVVLLALVIPLAVYGQIGDAFCDSGTLATTCTISSAKTLNGSQFSLNNLVIDSSGSITHTANANGTLTYWVNISAANITIASGGSITAVGRGAPGGTCGTGTTNSQAGQGSGGGGGITADNANDGGGGAGYAGVGGVGGYFSTNNAGSGGTFYGSLTYPTKLGSGGGGGNGETVCGNGGAGGGFIFLNVSGTLNNSGTISANGNAGTATAANYAGTGGGGSGGSIYINTSILVGSGTLTANGGAGGNAGAVLRRGAGGGGGGGRIAVYFDQETYTGTYSAYGSAFGTGSQNGDGTNGAPGTIYIKDNDNEEPSLIILNTLTPGGNTPLGTNNFTFGNLTLNTADVTVTGNINVTNTSTRLDSATLTMTSGNFFSGSDLLLSSSTLTSGQLGDLTNLNLSSSTATLSNSFTHTATNVGLVASTLTYASGSALDVSVLDLSGSTTLTTNFINSPTITISSSATLTHPATSEFGLNITVENLTVESGGTISAVGKGSSGGSCGTGTTNSQAGQGSGGGGGITADSANDGGGGAGYGGAGGVGGIFSSDNRGVGGSTYGSSTLPTSLGSGGGGGQGAVVCGNGGAGGGLIFLNVSGTLNNSGTISANGGAGSSTAANDAGTGGGGSGGSIYINTSILVGSGTLTANGGSGGNAGASLRRGAGGGGGGGRIAVYYSTNTSTVTFSVSGGAFGTGSQNDDGTNGTAGTLYLLQVDAVNPGITSVVANNSNPLVGDTIQLDWNVSDDNELASTWVTIQNSSGSFNSSLLSLSGTTGSGQYNHTVSSPEGTVLNFTAHVNDSSNNLNNSATLTLTVADVTNPSVAVVLPASNTLVNVSARIEIAANITDNVGLNVTYATVDYPNGVSTNVTLALASAPLYNASFEVPDIQGRFNVTFFANDTSGNSNNTETTFFVTNSSDRDNDGVVDEIDNVVGNESNVTTSGVTSLNVTVGGNATNASYVGSYETLFYDSATLLVNFTHNYSSSSQINMSRVSIVKTSTSLVVNFSGQVSNKTLYLVDDSFISLCVKDEEIASVSEISSGCTGGNETDFTSCIGNSTGVTLDGITCIDNGTRFVFQNLNFSGVRGGQASGGSSGGSSGGGGGGGGGRSLTAECNDRRDNDGDGLVDLNDPDCYSLRDPSESPSVIVEENETAPKPFVPIEIPALEQDTEEEKVVEETGHVSEPEVVEPALVKEDSFEPEETGQVTFIAETWLAIALIALVLLFLSLYSVRKKKAPKKRS